MKYFPGYVRERTQGVIRTCGIYSAMRVSARKSAHAERTIGVAIGIRQSNPCRKSELAKPTFETLKGNEMITQANKFLRLPLLAGGVAAIVVSGIAIAALAIAQPSLDGSAVSAEAMQMATVPADTAGGSRSKSCAECGVVESKRKMEMSDEWAGAYAAPLRTAAGRQGGIALKPLQNYEFTIRLRDGSMRVVTDANPAQWRLGERVTVIAGLQ